MKTKLLVVTLLLTSVFTYAQEKLTFEEMFRWFPEGKYEAAEFKDNLATTLPDFQKIKDITIGNNWNSELLLPETLKKHWKYIVQMTSVKIVVSIKEEVPEMGRANTFSQNSVGDQCYVTNHFGYKMQVINFPPELNIKKLALSQKGVDSTEHKFAEMKVYFDGSEKKSPWQKEDYYFCFTPNNEIIACVNLELLEKMVKAENGTLPCVVDDFPFPYLLDVLPELNHYWSVNDQSARINALRSKLEKDEVSPALIEKTFSNKSYYAHSIRDHRLGKDPVYRRYRVFEDNITAQNHMSKMRRSSGDLVSQEKKMKSANSFNYSSRKFTCNGPFMITTLVYTDKFTEKYLAMRNHDREAYLKKKKQEAEEKAREVAENGETHEKRENQKR